MAFIGEPPSKETWASLEPSAFTVKQQGYLKQMVNALNVNIVYTDGTPTKVRVSLTVVAPHYFRD